MQQHPRDPHEERPTPCSARPAQSRSQPDLGFFGLHSQIKVCLVRCWGVADGERASTLLKHPCVILFVFLQQFCSPKDKVLGSLPLV